MTDFYDKVKRIVESETQDEALTLLFGEQGIHINTREYLEATISRFVRKKDRIIQKVPKIITTASGVTRIDFVATYDLLKDTKEIENIVFISNYVVKEWEKRRDELRREKAKETDGEARKAKQKEIDEYQNMIVRFSAISQLRRVDVLDYGKLSEDELKLLKEAVLIIQTIRDSIEHRNDNFNVGETVSINNVPAKFKVDIPIRYLEGFASGRIIARTEDEEVAKKTRYDIYPILKKVDFDPYKLESFFYHVSPFQISFLLSRCDNDIEKVYKLPIWCFDEKYRKLIDHMAPNGIDDERLKIINAFSMDIKTIPQNAEAIYKMFIDDNGNISDDKLAFLKMVPPYMYETKEAIRDLYKNLKGKKEKISEQDLKMFKNVLKGVNASMVEQDADNFYISVAIYLRNVTSVLQFLRGHRDEFSDQDVALMDKLIVSEYPDYKDNIFYLLNMISSAKSKGELNDSQIDFIVNSYNDHIRVLEGRMRLAPRVPAMIKLKESLGELIPTISQGTYIYGNVTLMESTVSDNLIALIQMRNWEKKLFTPDEKEHLKSNPLFGGVEYIDNVFRFIKFLSGYKDRILTEPEIRLLWNIDREKFNDVDALIDYVRTIAEKPGNITEEEADAIIASQGFDDFSDDVKNVLAIARGEGKEEYVALVNTLVERGLENKSIPNINYLLERVEGDYRRLSEFPQEMFIVDSDILTDMLANYDYNMCRSIFGMDNPKLIAVMLYANSVYGKCDNTVKSSVSIDPTDFILSVEQDTLNLGAINGIPPSTTANFANQFVDPKVDQSTHIINKLRNISAHFRMRPVYDNQGNICEDKIYLFDEDNNGINNFNIIIDVNKFLEVTRTVEETINAVKGVSGGKGTVV